jgi:replication factor A1
VVHDSTPLRITEISALNPYTARWVIKARVSSKGELRK